MSKNPERPISYKLLDTSISFADKKATCKVKMPSADGDERIACLLVMKASDIHCVKMMRECAHKNILRALIVAEKGDFFSVWTESFDDSLLKYLKLTALGSMLTHPPPGKIVMLPTESLQSFISQIFDVFGYLWTQGKYHGNFQLENTKYIKTLKGDRIVKLTGFMLKEGKTVKDYQAEDCKDVGSALKGISEIAVALSSKGHTFDCYIINDLSKRLKKFVRSDLEFINEEILGHPFFWSYEQVKTFFISQIPIAMHNLDFRNGVHACVELCGLPWNNKRLAGLLKVMMNYRATNNIAAYDFNDRINYVQFWSGLFAHELELQLSKQISAAMKEISPPIYMILFNLIPQAPRPPRP